MKLPWNGFGNYEVNEADCVCGGEGTCMYALA